MRRPRKAPLIVFFLCLLSAGAVAAIYGRGAAFVARAAGADGLLRQIAESQRQAVTQAAVEIPWREGHLRGRRFEPAVPTHRPILLLPGVHASGIDEPRLVGFASEIAAAGHPVVTAELADLTRYSVTVRSTDMIEDAASWVARRHASPGNGRIGLMGISFAGGLSIVAAARPALRDRLAFVLSLGGHGHLPRTLQYLVSGRRADGVHRPPHDYGLAIVLLAAAERVVPAAQAPALRAAILSFLEASRLDAVDKAEALREFARARTLALELPEPARTLMTHVNDRDVARLGPMLAPHLAALGGDAALSPDTGEAPGCKVYLLHGSDDNIIPAVESALLARTLRERGVRVRFLSTPLLTHANVDRSASVAATWALVAFWSEVLGS